MKALGGGSLLEVRGLSVSTVEGRPLLRDLDISLARDRVALLGRNGVGKSTLLELLAGRVRPRCGTVLSRVEPVLVRQHPRRGDAMEEVRQWHRRSSADPAFAEALAREFDEAGLRALAVLADASGLSRGEVRTLHLLAAKLTQPEMLLLDEPTEDLDESGVAWLGQWLEAWPHGLIVVSHDRRVLRRFEHFFLVAESGCRHIPGSFAAFERQLERENLDRQRQYARDLNTLADQERHNARVCQRRQRKKNVGRLHELRRRTSRARLNEKRSYAQESQGKAAKIRQARIGAVRDWALAMRRALAVTLPLEVRVPTLAEDDGRAIIALEGVSAVVDQRTLFEGLSMQVGRHRVAITGPNAAGKTTLLRVMLGQHAPTAGVAVRDLARIGSIAQGATDWMSSDSVIARLAESSAMPSLEVVARVLLEHKFPLALAERPLRSLSPGERVRAALICLFQRTPTVEVLVLDEPTHSLDFLGVRALESALRMWPGGLVVASHDRPFLESIGIEQQIVLDGAGGYRG